jgi:hypothetical protein
VFILYYIVRKMVVALLLKTRITLVLLNPKKLAYSFYNLVSIWCGSLEVWKVTFDERKIVDLRVFIYSQSVSGEVI